MKFFTPTDDFTHRGSFYAVPIYLDLEGENAPVVMGTNIIFDLLFRFMVHFHNYVVEFVTQVFAAITNSEYQAGFPFWIKEELKK